MSGTVLMTALVLIVLIPCTMCTIIVWLVLRYMGGRGMGVIPGNFALFVRGQSGAGTLWEPLVINDDDHNHDERYATHEVIDHALATHVEERHGPHDHDGRYAPFEHIHDQYVTQNALTLRLAALRVSNIPHNLRGALEILLASALLGALIGLLLDLTVLRHVFWHRVLDSVTGTVNLAKASVSLAPHYHADFDWLNAFGVITMTFVAGLFIGGIVLHMTWRRRDDQEVQEAQDANG